MPSAPSRRVFFAKPRPPVYALLCALLTLTASAASAQSPNPIDTPPPQPAPGQYVLHAYADLLRIPTLVIDRRGMPLPLLDMHSFSLQIDSGPAFHPVTMHMEGDEPISFAIVLDASGAAADLLRALPNTPGHGMPATLLPHDTVSVYAFDCRTFRSAMDLPSPHLALHDAVQRVLTAPGLHNPKGKTCRDKKQLWEAINLAARDLAAQPGWRAMIVLTDGEDNGSRIKWLELAEFASSNSITIFGLREQQDRLEPLRIRGVAMPSPALNEDHFAEMAGRTGGLIFESDAVNLAQQVDHIVPLLRSRYILQFPRPALMTGGRHHLEVHVPNRDTLVLAAGTSAPARDATLLSDPTTVPMDTSKLPVVGNRKPIKP